MEKRYISFFIVILCLSSLSLYPANGPEYKMEIPLDEFQKLYGFNYFIDGKVVEISLKGKKILLGENSKTYSFNGQLGSFTTPVRKIGPQIIVPMDEMRKLLDKLEESVSHQSIDDYYERENGNIEEHLIPPKIRFRERTIEHEKKSSYLHRILDTNENYIKSNFSHHGKLGIEFKTAFMKPDTYEINEKHLQRHFITGAGFKWGIFDNLMIEACFSHWYDTKRGIMFGRPITGERKIDLKPLSVNFFYYFNQHKRNQLYLGIGGSKIYGDYEYRDAEILDTKKNDVATLNLYGGVEHFFNNHFSIFFNMMYMSGDINFQLEKLNINDNIVLDGLYFELGGIIWLW